MHWVEALDRASGTNKRYGFIEAKDEEWILSPKIGNTLLDADGGEIAQNTIDTSQESRYSIATPDGRVDLVLAPTTQGDKQFSVYGYAQERALTIGSAADNTYVYPSKSVAPHHARIDLKQDRFTLTDLGSTAGTFVNGARLASGEQRMLEHGDIVRILNFTLCAGDRFFSMNNPGNSISVTDDSGIVAYEGQPRPEHDPAEHDDDADPVYFYPAPRFKRDIERAAFTVDAPPAPEKPDETPIAMKIGPSMVMAFAAVFSGVIMFQNMMESSGNVLRAMSMLVMAVSMLTGAVLWPILSRKFENKKCLREETKRRATYAAYLDKVRGRIAAERETQREILCENRVSVAECMRRLVESDPHLMDRTISHDDFLELRLGMGTVPLAADIRFPDERFQVEEDELLSVVHHLAQEPTDITQAPLAIDLKVNPVVGIAGAEEVRREFVNGLLTQIVCLHTYEDMKCVILTDEATCDTWEWATYLLHAMDDSQSARYSACGLEEASEIGLTLERIAEERSELAQKDLAEVCPHYVVVCTSKRMADKAEVVRSLAKRRAAGFTVITLADTIGDLPKQCTSIIEVERESASLRDKSDTSGKPHTCVPDIFVDQVNARSVMEHVNRVALDLEQARESLPDALGFMEMYEAGNLEQLNVRARWRERKASTTLAAPVGRDAQGEAFSLNLHEKFHGPHGLIAGTTGSGKSEFIISWVLSMCVNYSPDEAAFVLIDYKGGGLAGAFDNDRARLPHLAGTITNLDGAAINRSLVSIKSELKRRQALFNEAREVAGGDNVDIYSYLELYAEGRVSAPCPHLFIVADEFAELKAQEPEFMDELISAARIGRSLGVHLVLATQKPTGVVNDQIWSNSKFKVCLKVADKADSNEMIKRADAAEITQAGRFYLLVGYNEYFACAQSAYTGTPYVALEQYKPPKDDSVALVTSTGRMLSGARPQGPQAATKPSPELVAILAHLAEMAEAEDLYAQKLWLDPLPAHITVDELREKYADELAASETSPFELNPIVGELDDPENQAQHVLTLPLTAEGNAIIYGAAGSGVETVLSAMLYSLLHTHGPDTLNTYIMDFGAETLGAFRAAPQVGDVVFASDEEKIENLLKMLGAEMQRRKKLLANVGGDRTLLKEQTGENLASILVIINNFETLTEVYEKYLAQVIELSRDGMRSGIYFVASTSRANGVPYRVLPNFKQRITLALNSNDEYLSVFGSLKGVVPPQGYARGLVKDEEGLFTYQGASVAQPQEELHFIREYCGGLAMESPKQESALSVPTLPEKVVADTLLSRLSSTCLPVGIAKESLDVLAFDFASEPYYVISGNDINDIKSLLSGIVDLLKASEVKWSILDTSCVLTGSDVTHDIQKIEEQLAAFSQDPDIDHSEEILIIPSLTALQNYTSQDVFNAFKAYLEIVPTNHSPRIIACDEVVDLMAFGIAAWYKKITAKGNGVWIGSGISTQTLLKYGRVGVRLDENPPEGIGYFICKNKATAMKHLVEK